MDDLHLEKNLHEVSFGDRVDLVATVRMCHPGSIDCTTVIHHQKFSLRGELPRDVSRFAVVNAIKSGSQQDFWLAMDAHTTLIPHSEFNLQHAPQVIEACSGIGAVGQGFRQCGLTTSCYIDSNEKFCRWIQDRSRIPVIHGSIADSVVIGQVHRITQGEQILSGGVSCQPFSSLGDRKEQHDPRSISFPSLLRMGFFLNVIGIIMECTKEVMESAWAQSILQAFSSITGFRVSQTVLHLHRTWPAFRTRWWAVVSHPSIPEVHLPPMPDISFAPGVLHLIPRLLDLPPEQLHELECDLYELRHFHSNPRGVQSFILSMLTPMPTATHSWGSQLRGCECGCRASGFSLHRIQSSGLYAVLWPLKQTIKMNHEEITKLRHLHPQEVALMNGLNPEFVTPKEGSSLRLDLAGVGQMASPLQGAWVLSHFLQSLQFQETCNFAILAPKQVLHRIVDELFEARDRVWNSSPVTSYMEIFRSAIYGVLKNDEMFVEDHDILTQDILKATKDAEFELSAYPQESQPGLHETVVPGEGEAFELFKQTMFAEIQNENETILVENEDPDGDDVFPKQHGSPILDDGYGEDTWQCPYNDCVICSPDIVVEKPSFDSPAVAPLLQEPREVGEDVSKNPKFSAKFWEFSGGFSRGFSKVSQTIPFTVAESSKAEIQDPFTTSGGIRAFTKRKRSDEASATEADASAASANRESVQATSSPDLVNPVKGECSVPSPALQSDNSEEVKRNGQGHFVQVFTPGESAPIFVRMPESTTAGSITLAETALGNMCQPIGIRDAVGCAIPLGSTTTPFQQIFTHYIPTDQSESSPCSNGPVWPFALDRPIQRIDILRSQQAWVALDEMEFYLGEVRDNGFATVKPPIACEADDSDFGIWIEDLFVAAIENDLPVATACIFQNHWIPFVVQGSHETQHVFTTPEGLKLVHTTSMAQEDSISCHTVMLPQAFSFDCGFQALGWIGHVLEDSSIREALLSGDRQWVAAITPSMAVQWRRNFEHRLLVHDFARTCIQPRHLHFGGVYPQDSPDARVEQLLTQHGVPASEATKRTQQVIACIGRGPIVQALRSKQDWAEIKMLANAQHPRLQLVLPSELANAIKQRADSGQSFGDKKKKQRISDQPKVPLVMNPQDVSIPDGLFKQGDDSLISQIALSAIRQDASGIVVVSAHQAQPYLKLAKPLSSFGLALLVMDHSDPIFTGIGQVIRFPGRFEKTGEPFIGTGRLIQLGSMEVCRYYPQSQIKVDEVTNHVFRVVVYKDEFQDDWNDFIQRPIKHALDFMSFKNGGEDEGVIDVWDRQWLSLRMERQKPKHSEVFQVNLRVTGVDEKQVMASSGTRGYYVEPRSVDGRSPSDAYRVVWLPKTDFATATTSLQAAQTWACLVRTGKRFGLRTLSQDAQQIHDQYKPQTPFLESGSITHYLVGPLPFGATKATLGRVFSKWGWVARPVQPRGRSSDGGGILWEVHASQTPECEAYSMDHGDVIISELNQKKSYEKNQTDIVASARTIAAMQASQSSEPRKGVSKPSGDGIFDSDPWAGYVPASKVSKHAASTDSSSSQSRQFEALTATVDRKIAAAIAQVDEKMATPASDAVMHSGVQDRVQVVEDRLSKIEQVVQAQHHQMQQQHGQVNTQLTKMQHQLDQQSHVFQEHLDQRMTEQLSQIEKLLGKKGRYE